MKLDETLCADVFNAIETLLKDAERLKNRYGVQSVSLTVGTVSRHIIRSNALKRLRVRLGRSSNGLDIWLRRDRRFTPLKISRSFW